MFKATCVTFAAAALAVVMIERPIAGQEATLPTKAAPIEKISANQYRLGKVRVDTAKSEVSVSGKLNPSVTTLEFIANTKDGWRAYESALSLDTDAITYNAALLLIGLDGKHVKGTPQFHFDPTTLSGDVVTVTVECPGGECARMPAERLMYDKQKKETVSGGKWIYTGSSLLPDGRYLADVGAVLIGFVHDPATIIEYSAGAGLGNYGSIVVNPTLGLPEGTAITLTVKATTQPSR